MTAMSGASDPIDEAARQWVAHGWQDAADGMATVTRLVRVHQLLQSAIEAILRPHGLTFARFEVLRLLEFSRAGAMSMGRLGQLLQVRPASVTHAVGALEGQGYVTRSPNPADGRGTIAAITPAGRDVVGPATDDLNRWFETVGASGGDQSLGRALKRLEAGLATNPPTGPGLVPERRDAN